MNEYAGASGPPTGTRLESALLPATDFDPSALAQSKVSSGSDLILAVDGVDALSIARVSLGSPQAPTALIVRLIASVEARR
jgi:hypothetical protein